MDNYIVINGKKAELTQEQLEKLGIVVEKDPFERVDEDSTFYWINNAGRVMPSKENQGSLNLELIANANYCTDKELMEQRALHETLNRLLWRYSMQNGGRETKNGFGPRYQIVYLRGAGELITETNYTYQDIGAIYFKDETTAENAIEEIVKPFIEQHPEFRW